MHWRAITQSTRSHESSGFRAYDGAQSESSRQKDYSIDRESLHSRPTEISYQQQQEGASKAIPEALLLTTGQATDVGPPELISQREDDSVETHSAFQLPSAGFVVETDRSNLNNDRLIRGDPTRETDHNISEDTIHLQEAGLPIPQGQDDASDPNLEVLRTLGDYNAETKPENPKSDDYQSTEDEDDFLQIPMPDFSTGLTTFAYHGALGNRIRDSKLAGNGEYDRRRYPPTFIHDCLMLPGSLANVIGKDSPEHIIRKMTPALLPGFHAYVHAETQQSCLLQSANNDDYVHGMVILGQGTAARNLIHQHYRLYARRVKVQVEIDVQISLPVPKGAFPLECWSFQRRRIWAHAWLWSDAASADADIRRDLPGWTLEDYLAGNFEPAQPMKTGRDGFIGRDYDADIGEDESDDAFYVAESKDTAETEQREIVYHGYGSLDYERDDAAVGWW